MLVDANLLLYAANAESPFNQRASRWLETTLAGDRRVALPWLTIGAFVRVITHPRLHRNPLRVDEAWDVVESWLALDVVWTPAPGPGHAAILGRVLRSTGATGNLVTDAQLAALAIEHGLTVCSADSDFARFSEVRWHNPLR